MKITDFLVLGGGIIGSVLSLTVCLGIEPGPAASGQVRSGQQHGLHQGSTRTTFAQKVTLQGAGATFPFPIYSRWFQSYAKIHPETQIDYQSVGSGTGVEQYRQGTVDFAATDVPLSDKDFAALPRPPLQIPTVAHEIVPVYNVRGMGNGLKLSGDVLADIFLGKITKWNDVRIRRENRGIVLPAQTVTVVHPAYGSGATQIVTHYLSVVSPEWKAKVGEGKVVNWPIGYSVGNTPGVVGLVVDTSGSIGFDELAYAIQNRNACARVRNRAGKYVMPTMAGAMAAANAAAGQLGKDIRTSIVNGPGEDTYPIVGFTYLLVPQHPKDVAKGRALLDFLQWTMGPGQKMAPDLWYAPLPPSITALNVRALNQLRALQHE